MYFLILRDGNVRPCATKKEVVEYLTNFPDTTDCSMVFRGKRFYANRFTGFKFRKMEG